VDAINQPLSEFYGKVLRVYTQVHRGKTITAPGAPSGSAQEKAIELLLQPAKEELDRELRSKLQKPSSSVPLS
jgi:hypothetical protein